MVFPYKTYAKQVQNDLAKLEANGQASTYQSALQGIIELIDYGFNGLIPEFVSFHKLIRQNRIYV